MNRIEVAVHVQPESSNLLRQAGIDSLEQARLELRESLQDGSGAAMGILPSHHAGENEGELAHESTPVALPDRSVWRSGRLGA
jgi:hypothetical protein